MGEEFDFHPGTRSNARENLGQVAIINHWVDFCLAVGSLQQTEAAALFIKVLWCQSDFNTNRVDEPLELLRKAQVDSLKKPIVRKILKAVSIIQSCRRD
jgi:hypothetical protein